MSQVFQCAMCSRRTTEPFEINGTKLCTICAEWEDPEVVDRRERRNWKKYQQEAAHSHKFKERFGIR